MRGPKWDTLNLSNDGLSKEFNTWPLIPGILTITSELFSVLHEGCKTSSCGSDPMEKTDTFNNWHQCWIFFRVKIFKLKILGSNKEGNWKNTGASFFLKMTEKWSFHTIYICHHCAHVHVKLHFYRFIKISFYSSNIHEEDPNSIKTDITGICSRYCNATLS